MKTFAQRITLFVAGTALFTACSRPYATVQRTPAEKFATVTKSEAVQTIAPAQNEAPVAVQAPVATPEVETPATPAPQAQLATVRAQLNEAVASNKEVMADKRVQKKMAKINAMLDATAQQATMAPVSNTAAKKMNLMERTMVKKIDKKIKKQMAPDQPMAKSLLTLGAIIAIAGLILMLLGVASPLGIIALIVGLVLILVDLLR
ncbi:hypothetical protein F5984_14240 [Rudanella paleaurantiibacter]|uniref:Uncharacterized protein n=1 Tax=Rudanella paleaurantiibacter TaxID=2614655 RepID=A0A7J5TYU4_9BACT|nr:hypothetical protein [Rudanella paleaurantiibacter]KAB7730318.1 hypothetical protein F5984_14240 [Rudanella paleaurantiibacter]